MSISRKNWSALSSLARQWTVEDEEEVERERRRRGRSSSSMADPDNDLSPVPGQEVGDIPTNDSSGRSGSIDDGSQGVHSPDQLDFVEMLRIRDEKRKMRHVETLARQKKEGEGEETGLGGGVRIELLGDIEGDNEESQLPQTKTPDEPAQTHTPTPLSPTATANSSTNRQHDNEASSGKDIDTQLPSTQAHKFSSSVSISLDKSPSRSEGHWHTTPMSPCSPTASMSLSEQWPSPCRSPSPQRTQSPLQNGHTREVITNGPASPEASPRQPPFIRQSSRTASFRMLKKKEEEKMPLQRSSSVRLASQKFESNMEQNQNEQKTSPFQRNSRQRISSRSIQEKMERLAQAAQKSDTTRSPDVTQRTLFLLEEVSRKRGLFEKEQPAAAPTSPGVSRQEFRSFTSGVSDRINRLLHKANQPETCHAATDLRHVNISSKRSLFESRGENDLAEVGPGTS